MGETTSINLDSVSKSQVAVCQDCGVLFVKPVKGLSGGILFEQGYYCPVCDKFVCKENEQ